MNAPGEPGALALRVTTLPPMPRTAASVLQLTNDPRCSAEQMSRVIESDPALAGAVLRLVNSATFGTCQPVASLAQAVVLIGFLRLRSLMLATIAAGLRDMIPPAAGAARDRAWEHSVDTALAARAIARRLGLGWHEEAFAGGLLHDCGRLVLLAQRPAAYLQLVNRLHGALPDPVHEHEELGMDHAEVGGALLRAWNQAPQLCDAAEHHHDGHELDSPHACLVDIVVVADHLFEKEPGEPVRRAAERIGITEATLAVLPAEIAQEVAEQKTALLGL